ncbi:DUF2514 family protein [Pseudomonas simiae]|jgi:hypothetical protein|uniref:DUF2514 family protein n=1 Tax=Pseudomonas simiae TaxID=321846 RepID=A0ABS9G947_9PSED|nr:DUF2514 family protein [Pseudomonas simiae]MBI6614250.1 DUF2514 family protein [Pseudomonas simiae]MCF5049920.1 DUF2514 family protein [Pseudomonas simiae]MCF5189856.1 DUF2514 family protein [Pseudomonas simiae]MCF5286902.1 DUF2514 family protein [Pseudomonas simiae]MCF5319948.1 DUF2514 family protein [Pseudomonas simiae]
MTPVQKLLALLVAVAIGFGAAWQVQDWRYGTRLADIGKAQAIAVTKAGNDARAEEQRRQASVNKEASNAREQNKAADVDAGAADAAGDRLHVDAGKLAASACPGDSGVAQRGASATRAAMVLSDLLQRADKRAGELAAAYDRARIAGLACERSYQSMTYIRGREN